MARKECENPTYSLTLSTKSVPQLAGYNLYGKEEVPAGGIVTGVGRVR